MIDIRTFMLVLAIGNIAFAMLMAGYARSGSDIAAMGVWKQAKLVQGFAHLLGFLRPDFPWLGLIVTANTMLVLGLMLEVAAYCTFFGCLRWKRPLYACTLLALAVFHVARFSGVQPDALFALMSFIVAAQSGTVTYMLLRRRAAASPLQRIIGWNNLVFFIALSLRAVGALIGGGGVFAPSPLQAATFVLGYLLLIVNGFGFLLLCKESDDRKMALLATIDSLTGLVNRRAFFERTDSARLLAARTRQPISLMMLDLDHFKSLNDRHGHAAGDEALCSFAATAQATLREHDIMGRLGGEEFALVLPGTDLAGAIQAAERLRVAVEHAGLPRREGAQAVTVSIGVVTISPEEHINAALARADHALYAAKSAGRNRVEPGEPFAPNGPPQLRCA